MGILNTIQQFAPEAIELRRELHRHPELSGHEVRTTARIRQELEKYGIPVVDSGMETGIIAILKGTACGQGKTLALRADIDALPVTEATGLPFASENVGVCHACGHDLHTAALLLCAWTLKAHEAAFSGTVKFLFQPAEETGVGARTMIAHGAMENPRPDMIIAAHTWPDTPAGSIGWYKGGAMASSDIVGITVKGQGGHGAHPYRCIDPITTAAYLIAELQTILSREVPAIEAGVLTFGMIQGGSAANTIPNEVVIQGTMRTLSSHWREKMFESIRRISDHCCKAMRAEAEVEIHEGMPVLENDPAVIDRIVAAACAELGPDHVKQLNSASMGSEDFSHYLSFAPGALFRMGTGTENPDTHRGLHNAANQFGEEAISASAAVMARTAVDFCR